MVTFTFLASGSWRRPWSALMLPQAQSSEPASGAAGTQPPFRGHPSIPPCCSSSTCPVSVFSPFNSLFILKILFPFFFPLFLSSLCFSCPSFPWCVCGVECSVYGEGWYGGAVCGGLCRAQAFESDRAGFRSQLRPSLSHVTVGSHFLGLGFLICKMGLMCASHEAMQVLRTCPVSPLTCSLSSLFSPFISSPSFPPLSPQ